MYVDVDTHGPVFDARWFAVMKDITEDTEKDSAEHAYNLIEQRAAQVFRTHPTGRWEQSVNRHPAGGDQVVDDGGIIYGFWLEGIGSRNAPVTRFKGYFTFRLVRQKMRREMKRFAQAAYLKHKGRLGG